MTAKTNKKLYDYLQCLNITMARVNFTQVASTK